MDDIMEKSNVVDPNIWSKWNTSKVAQNQLYSCS